MPPKKETGKKFKKGKFEPFIAIRNLHGRREIGYTPWFRNYIRRHPKIIKNFLKAISQMSKTQTIVEIDGVYFTKIFGIGNKHKALYLVDADRKRFFVKEIDEPISAWHGPILMRNFERINVLARASLKKFGAEVIRYHYYWKRKRVSGSSRKITGFFVADFYDLPSLQTLTENKILPKAKEKEVLQRIIGLGADLLKLNIADVDRKNCFYDEKRDKIILFDISLNKVFDKKNT